MKFAIMHIDQPIELFMKERVRAGGRSIYKAKNSKETLGIYGLYDVLDELGCRVPERANLEMLHEERNAVQHKYLNPSPEDASFHLSNGLKFLSRFLRDELSEDIYGFAPAEVLDSLLS